MKTIQEWERHIDSAIRKAERHESAIDESILSIRGFSTGVMRRLISNLCQFEGCVYLEAGLYGGASICSAMNNNPGTVIYGVENGSQDFGDPTIQQHLNENILKYRNGAKEVTIIDSDFFALDLMKIKHPVNVFFYDAHHAEEFQAKALPCFYEALAPVFLWIVDDYHWPGVNDGSQKGLAWAEVRGATVQSRWKLSGERKHEDPTYWNGMGLFLISKP